MARCHLDCGPGSADPVTFLRDRLGIETEKVPAALWVFVVVSIAWALIAVGIRAARSEPLPISLLGMPLTLGLAWLILRRSRVVWSLLVFGSATTLITVPFSPSPWWLVAVTAFDLFLFLTPPTWRFIWRDRPARTGRSESGVQHSDLDLLGGGAGASGRLVRRPARSEADALLEQRGGGLAGFHEDSA